MTNETIFNNRLLQQDINNLLIDISHTKDIIKDIEHEANTQKLKYEHQFNRLVDYINAIPV